MMTRGLESHLEEEESYANMRSHKFNDASLCVQMPWNDVLTIIIMIGYTIVNVATRKSLHYGFQRWHYLHFPLMTTSNILDKWQR